MADPDSALDRVVTVQTQYAMSLEVALAIRSRRKVKGWERKALAEDGHLHKSWGLRRTLHTHGPQGWAVVHGALGERWHTRFHRKMPEAYPEYDFRAIEAKILEALADGPKSRPEIHTLIPEIVGMPYAGWGLDVMGAAFLGRLKVIGRGADQRFALAEPPASAGSGLTELLRVYLRGYGPATRKDFAYWVGLPLRDIVSAFAELAEEMVETPAGFALAEMSLEAPRPPRALLLAKFDPLTMGHVDKSRWLRSEDYGRVFRKAAQVEAVVLLKGRAAATWRVARAAKSALVTVESFRTLRPPERAAIERAAAKLGASIGWGAVEVAIEP